MAFRIESGRLDKAQRTPGGGFRIPAAVGRTGVLVYRKADGSEWREYRPPEEAFAADSLASLRAATVTDLHPTREVTPETYRAVVRGHVGDEAKADDEHIVAPLYIQDAELIRGIEAGERREVSAGYHVDLDLTPGTAPSGEHYDAVQRNIRYNHIAVGPVGWGRAGSSVALRLDANLDTIMDLPAPAGSGKERTRMKITLRVDGVDREIDVEEPAAKVILAAMAERDAEAKQLRKDATDALAASATAAKERDEARGRADSLEAEAKKQTDPKALSAKVAARVALEKRAALLRDVKADGMTDREVMLAALSVEGLDKESDDYVRARFDAEVERAERADASHRDARLIAQHSDKGEELCPMEQAQLRMIARNRDGWKREEV